MFKVTTICGLLLVAATSFAQKQGNIWCFGFRNKLDFNNSTPSASNCAINQIDQEIEGTASISDSLGRLLFYSDGRRLWDWNNQIIVDTLSGHQSATHAAYIIPRPGYQSEYYLFTLDAMQNQLQNGLRYSRVSACRDGGVSVDNINTLLADFMTEKMVGIKHSNGVDYWLIAHEYGNNRFHAYLIDQQGIHLNGTYDVGVNHQDELTFNAAVGSMKASPNGLLIAVAITNSPHLCELFSFNPSIGTVSHLITFAPDTSSQGTLKGQYGLSFSPSSRYIYFTQTSNHKIWQFDIGQLELSNDAFLLSRSLIHTSPNGSFAQIQLSSSGRIYLSKWNSPYLSIITDPDSAGLNCNFGYEVVQLTYPLQLGLPAFIDSYHYTASGICEPNVIAEFDEVSISIYPNPASQTLRIKIQGSEFQVRNVAITDVLGHKVLNSPPSKEGSREASFEMNISHLAPGLYTVSATLQNGETLRQRLVVQR
jgi:hypothetical protein